MYTFDASEVKSSTGPSAIRTPCSAISTNRGVAVENTVMPGSMARMGVRVRAGLHRRLRGDDAHPNCSSCPRRRAGARLHDAHHRHGENAPRVREACRRGRVARDDDELHAALDEPAADLLHETVHFLEGARAVRAARRVAHVDDGLLRKGLRDLAGHGEPSETGSNTADGRVVPPGKEPVAVCILSMGTSIAQGPVRCLQTVHARP